MTVMPALHYGMFAVHHFWLGLSWRVYFINTSVMMFHMECSFCLIRPLLARAYRDDALLAHKNDF